MTSVLLSFVLVLAWGSWIPVAQAVPALRQATRTFYATTGNLAFAALALVVGGSAGQLTLGWKEFWLPLAGGVVWTVGSVCAFRATELIGLARAAGTWTPLNIIVAFVFGAALFSELSGFSAARYAVLAGCLVLVLAGVFLIIGSQGSGTAENRTAENRTAEGRTAETRTGPDPDPGAAASAAYPLPAVSPLPAASALPPASTATSALPPASAAVSSPSSAPAPATALATAPAAAPAPPLDAAPAPPLDAANAAAPSPATYRRGLLLAVGAGVLWGGYFIPAQWAHVPSQLGNFPLAVGMFAAAVVLAARERAIVRLTAPHTGIQLGAGLLLGIGSVALLGLVPRIGTGAGFTIAQLSLLVNAGVGIWGFKVPAPGSRAARIAIAGIVLAGIGGTIIGTLR